MITKPFRRLGLMSIGFALTFGLSAAPARASVIIPTVDVEGIGMPTFAESLCPGGDAGSTIETACAVDDKGPYSVIDGTIGGLSVGLLENTNLDFPNGQDFVDIFAFAWLTTADFIASYNGPEIALSLLTYPDGEGVPGDQDPLPWGIIIPQLPSGDYALRLDAQVDPPFSIVITGPTTGPNVGPPSPNVPEPASLLLWGTALAVAARVRRRARA